MALKYSILGLLHHQPMHGYRIKEHIERNFGHMWSINYGQIYPNLKKMLAEGLISMAEENCVGEKGPPRKKYSLTEKGRQAFADWLGSSPERRMLLRDPFLMRFVFFGFGDKERSLELIDEQIADWQHQLSRRQASSERWKESGLHARLMADLGMRVNQVLVEWLQQARHDIEAETTLSVPALPVDEH